MKTWIKVLVVTGLIAVPAMMLRLAIWPNPEGAAASTAVQMPYLLLLALCNGVLLGLELSFFGWPVIRKVSPSSRMRAYAMYLSIGWLMVSWWPHLNINPVPDPNIPTRLHPFGKLLEIARFQDSPLRQLPAALDRKKML